ncbi:MAG: glycogen/starch/alpha-glucan phosphorylase [Eubacteriales bacterium]|nr:glycogen/starch/alpha-glucan phosphorylase [Eubacteriales bacterium]
MDGNLCTQIKQELDSKLLRYFNLKDEETTPEQMYLAAASVLRDTMLRINTEYKEKVTRQHAKRVYYISMEFLVGRQMRNALYNLQITDEFREAVKSYGHKLEDLYELERDPGLGNGGLGRLAACYIDSLASMDIPATGFTIRYEYGIFKQRIVDGWQTELPDAWIDSGDAWQMARHDEEVEVRFGGHVEENWTEQGLKVEHKDYYTVLAVPYTLPVPGYGGRSVDELRLWEAKSTAKIDMKLFSSGQYMDAMEANAMAEVISKVLYPDDNHFEGKSLRLKQQYFLVSATIQYIVRHHFKRYGTLTNLPQLAAIQLNDTHPALAVPELMRILMDDYGYDWGTAWQIVTNTIAYTNHTVMPEALEQWSESLFRMHLPRIYSIVHEINERQCRKVFDRAGGDWDKVSRMSVINHGYVRMANLSIFGSHRVNGVSSLHSDILKKDTFRDFYSMTPDKFTNVTNGIAHRRWLCQANPQLDALIEELIGPEFRTDASRLQNLKNFAGDTNVLMRLDQIKRANKSAMAEYIAEHNGITVSPDAVFDVQVKRLHEYKRQLLNVMNIIDIYFELLENPDYLKQPHVFAFGAKAAPGYYMAKRIIRLISGLSDVINHDARLNDMLKVVFLEDYNVTLAEKIIPAAEISQQISQAGKEASGTSNMKFMMNGALTIGTLDGANVEMFQNVGPDNIFIFGLHSDEVEEMYTRGYMPTTYYQNDPRIQRAVDAIMNGVFGDRYNDIAQSLLTSDHYMLFADFESYRQTHRTMDELYADRLAWNRKSLQNIACSGVFAADRSIRDYLAEIWHAEPVE